MTLPTSRWFGDEPFNGNCVPDTKVPTPVGTPCAYCDELLNAQDRGLALPHLTVEDWCWAYFHRECFFRTVIGSVGHQQGLCGCDGSADADDSEVNLTRRKGALAAWAYYVLNAASRVRGG